MVYTNLYNKVLSHDKTIIMKVHSQQVYVVENTPFQLTFAF